MGLYNLNSYYDPDLKGYRLYQLQPYPNFRFVMLNLAGRECMADLFRHEQFQRVIHLAEQAGMHYSLEAPFDYVDSNLVGTMAIFEGCRQNRVEQWVYASSSSVSGMNTKVAFS